MDQSEPETAKFNITSEFDEKNVTKNIGEINNVKLKEGKTPVCERGGWGIP